MEFLRNIFSETIIEATGWMLFHSLWQASIIAFVLFLILLLFNKYTSRARYIISYTALLAMLVWSAITFNSAYNYASRKQDIVQSISKNPDQIKEIVKEQLLENTKSTVTSNNAKAKLKWIKFRGFMLRNFPIIYTIWLLGVLLFVIRMAGGMIYLFKLKNKFTKDLEDHLQNTINQFQQRLGLSQRIESFQSTLAQVPMVIGYLKPVILIPASLITGLSSKELEAIIAHELAHIKRHDYILNILQSAIEVIYFYHPAVWLISKFIRDERENSCDELALELTGDKINYLKALTAAQELQHYKYQNLKMAFSGNKGSLLQRVIRIKNFSTMKKSVTEGFIAASIVFIGLILVSFSFDGQNLKKDSINQQNENILKKPEKPVKKIVLKKQAIHQTDSITKEVITTMEEVPEEMEQIMEMAYTFNDQEFTKLIQESLELARAEIKMDEIMQQVDSAMKAADINAEIAEAIAEAKMELAEECNDSIKIAVEALEIASETIEAIDISGIVSMAMEQAEMALENINLEEIMDEAMNATKEALEDIDMEQIMQEAKEAQKEAINALEEEYRQREEAENSAKDIEEYKHSSKAKEKELEAKLRELED